MNSLPSTSQTRAPLARLTKNGWTPTARNARTGEFTPPGMYFNASAKSFSDLARTKLFLNERFPQRAFLGADDGAGVDVVAGEPAVFDLQNELDVIRGGGDGVGIVLFEVMDFRNDAVRADVGRGKRFRTVFHPELSLKRPGEDKQHRAR